MKILCLDETANIKDSQAFGLCAVVIDSAHYGSLQEDFSNRFSELKWSPTIEFKGRYIFSQKGDPSVTIDRRLEFVRDVIKLNVAQKNSKLKVAFAWNRGGNGKENEFRLLKVACSSPKIFLANPPKTSGKHLCSVFVDKHDNIGSDEWDAQVRGVLAPRGYQLVEGVTGLPFDASHMGLIYADLIAYLTLWRCLSNDLDEAGKNVLQAAAVTPDKRKIDYVRETLGYLKNIQCTEEKPGLIKVR